LPTDVRGGNRVDDRRVITRSDVWAILVENRIGAKIRQAPLAQIDAIEHDLALVRVE
jgi:hypothetical protein